MTKIYSLSIDENIFYIGKTTRFLAQRLTGHLATTKGIKELPNWLKKMISINTIEECDNNKAASRERYWIYFYAKKGIKLLNKNCVQPLSKQPKYEYIKLTETQKDFIKLKIGYTNAANLFDINPETIRIATVKGRLKRLYFEKIFAHHNKH